ncbi:MAG: hypothetical protein ABS87_02790 [Sphingomonas sp. SCN 67-18]|uniref:cell wall hydrolase n=1 Tax=uncultured Sphingomonas sp. TaxID=158754 RepID=UPI00086C6499|nr:cell wall hydrolase [Sphingomonas sp. SCN 67-18]ODU22292.1 MAG: hypothetical protein ABS87_02790 [Sphingomonas sp. SCN 67-18]
MSFTLRAASIAAVALSMLAALAATAPSFALDSATTPVSAQSLNDVTRATVPALPVDPAAISGNDKVVFARTSEVVQSISRDDAAAAVSLASLVANYDMNTPRDREDECLAGAVYFESKGESLDGQLAVAQVIINRASSGRFPRSLCSVVFQPSQFSFVRGGDFPPIDRSSRAWREAAAIAHVASEDLWDSSVSDALFFHASHVSPGWRKQRIARVGNHVFYR